MLSLYLVRPTLPKWGLFLISNRKIRSWNKNRFYFRFEISIRREGKISIFGKFPKWNFLAPYDMIPVISNKNTDITVNPNRHNVYQSELQIFMIVVESDKVTYSMWYTVFKLGNCFKGIILLIWVRTQLIIYQHCLDAHQLELCLHW